MSTSFGFDLRALEVFVQVVESGTMTAAAERLGMTQSSVSQSLSNLEDSLGIKLLDRSVRPMESTTPGRFFYDRASRMLAEARKTRRDIQRGSFQQLHHVRIAVVDSIATAVGQPLIEAVKDHTEEWSITTGLSHLHGHALLSHNVDIIISDDALEDYSDLTRYRILQEPFVLVVPADFEEGEDNFAKLQRQYDFVRYSMHSLIGLTVERHLRRMHLEPPSRLQLDNTFAVLSAVAAGIGWTITTPLCLFQSGLINSRVRCLPLPGDPLTRNLTLVARRNELGGLPQTIAADSCQILRERFLPTIKTTMPWVAPHIKVGE